MLKLLASCIIVMMRIKGVYISFQTEGFWQGLPAVQVACSFDCDCARGAYQSQPVNQIYALVEEGLKGFQFPFVVISGGEPTDQSEEAMELIRLIKTKNKDVEIQVETNAAGKMAKMFASRSGLLANIWLTVAPLQDKEPDKTLVRRANEIKLIVSDKKENLEFCRYFSSIASPLSKLRYQPSQDKDVNFGTAIENSFYLAKEFGGRFSIPLRKLAKIENLNFNKEMI